MDAFTCLLNSNINELIRADSLFSSTTSSQAGQKSPVTEGRMQLALHFLGDFVPSAQRRF